MATGDVKVSDWLNIVNREIATGAFGDFSGHLVRGSCHRARTIGVGGCGSTNYNLFGSAVWYIQRICFAAGFSTLGLGSRFDEQSVCGGRQRYFGDRGLCVHR